MTTLECFFLTLFTAGITIISYKGYAVQKGWPIGSMYYSDSSILKIIAMLSMLSSFIIAFFYIKWYFVVGGSLVSWWISGALTALFRISTQYIAIVMLILSFMLLIFK